MIAVILRHVRNITQCVAMQSFWMFQHVMLTLTMVMLTITRLHVVNSLTQYTDFYPCVIYVLNTKWFHGTPPNAVSSPERKIMAFPSPICTKVTTAQWNCTEILCCVPNFNHIAHTSLKILHKTTLRS